MYLLEKLFNLLQIYSNQYFKDRDIDFDEFWKPIEKILDKYEIKNYTDIKWKRSVYDLQVNIKNILKVAIKDTGEYTIYDYLNEIDVKKISTDLSIDMAEEVFKYITKK